MFAHARPAIIAILALTVAGCGLEGYPKPGVPYLTQNQISGSNPAPEPPADYNPDYKCPTAANVVPDYDYNRDGSDYFRVCPSKAKYSDILIHGQTHDSDSICIFPAEFVDGDHIYTKPDLSKAGSPIYQCLQRTSAGIFASFSNMNYNAAFIVESQFKDQMFTCLINQNYYNCPHYSFGKFR